MARAGLATQARDYKPGTSKSGAGAAGIHAVAREHTATGKVLRKANRGGRGVQWIGAKWVQNVVNGENGDASSRWSVCSAFSFCTNLVGSLRNTGAKAPSLPVSFTLR